MARLVWSLGLTFGLLLTAAASQAAAGAHLVPIAASPTGDGILNVPIGGSAAFAVAVINVGDATNITVNARVDSRDGAVPLTVSVCASNPTTGECVGNSTGIAAGGIRTYSVFVTATGPVPTGNALFGLPRIVVEFNFLVVTTTSGGLPSIRPAALYAATSVGVRTQP